MGVQVEVSGTLHQRQVKMLDFLNVREEPPNDFQVLVAPDSRLPKYCHLKSCLWFYPETTATWFLRSYIVRPFFRNQAKI